MRINHNISALKANNQLGKTNRALDSSLEKLSSGYRINSAADDSAGLAISEKMRTQIAGLDQASRNASDGISVIQTAEGALIEVEAMLQRMRELSVQSANGTYTPEDRKAIQAEIDQLSAEIKRISDTTEFNTMNLLDGNIDRKSYSSNTNVKLVSLSDTVSANDYQIEVKQDARQAVIVGKDEVNTSVSISAAHEGTININGVAVTVNEGDTYDDIFKKLRDAGDSVGVKIFATASPATPDVANDPELAGYESEAFAGGTQLVFVSSDYGSKEKIELHCDNPELAKVLGLTDSTAPSAVNVSVTGYDAVASISGGFNSTATVSISGNKLTVSDRNNFEMVIDIAPGTVGTVYTDETTAGDATDLGPDTTTPTVMPVDISVLDAGQMDLQIGANEGQIMSVTIPKVDPTTLGIDKMNIGTAEGAQAAITMLDVAINTVSAIRSKLGAYQNRLEHSISNLDTTSENLTESLSRISDVDMAEEMATYTQMNVLAQAGTSMLAQANQRPQTILSLLQQ
ncbi:MAG TPA: flagellar biosynthesis protein FlgL [Clostridiales bacterium]|nr:flagellar biosynthesis protein FlgL [Clostridiales bacterium]